MLLRQSFSFCGELRLFRPELIEGIPEILRTQTLGDARNEQRGFPRDGAGGSTTDDFLESFAVMTHIVVLNFLLEKALECRVSGHLASGRHGTAFGRESYGVDPKIFK